MIIAPVIDSPLVFAPLSPCFSRVFAAEEPNRPELSWRRGLGGGELAVVVH